MQYLIRVHDEAVKAGNIPCYSLVALSLRGRTLRVGMVVETVKARPAEGAAAEGKSSAEAAAGQVTVRADSGLSEAFLKRLGFDDNKLLTIPGPCYRQVRSFS